MSSGECDACCGCVPPKSAVRMCGIFKAVLSVLSLAGPSVVMVMSIVPHKDEARAARMPCLVMSFCSNFFFIEILNIFFSIILCCLAGKKPATNLYILCRLMCALNLLYFVGVVVISVYSTLSMIAIAVGFFLPSTLMTLYTTVVVWGLVRYEENAKDDSVLPPEGMKAADQPNGYDYNYGAPVYYGQPNQVQSYEAQVYQYQPYQVQSYDDQPQYQVQPDRSKAYGI